MKRLFVVPVAAVVLLSLTGCITVQVNPRDPRDGDGHAETTRTQTIACASDKDVTLNEPDSAYTVTGACRRVSVEGAGITVAAGRVHELIVRGDGNTVTSDEFSSLTVEGQRNEIATGDGGDATIRGNDNRLHSDGNLDAVSSTGQGNDIGADGFIASLDEAGEG